eukprot:CAMPEP_0194754694 /NCGR_PEP_ID=MMETSP0323_2-20130528/8632_1 /TAXON_ID=2866 ORGANISM="Crypthecodinium cohnii, Strain Seligo" /NCGR_SAMPLE_ID=MMETSP0323_2 /ASSEMBLY_ACC=CAM_ASM_000346 /LENGTH=82 /DNA_ID=CAMNT_0039673361 /DNA_START=441 /DNA_END=687 /DNA_ORIENTATION=-
MSPRTWTEVVFHNQLGKMGRSPRTEVEFYNQLGKMGAIINRHVEAGLKGCPSSSAAAAPAADVVTALLVRGYEVGNQEGTMA